MLELNVPKLACRNACVKRGDHERPPMGMGGGDDDFGGVGGMRGGKCDAAEGMPPACAAARR
ncbi:MAG: hypothetical protein IPP40_17020 [bacterium]|nr:hypothetical protein [bacterium]